jgi:hypothetical protein
MIERKKNDEEDVEALLPWYEKGTLPDEDAHTVEDYLKAHPADGNRFIELIREEVTETIEANEQAGMPSSAALNRLMESIAAEPKRAGAVVRDRAGGFFTRLFGQGAAPWLPVATAAACLVILVQAGTIGLLLTNPDVIEEPGPGRVTRSIKPELAGNNNQGTVLIRFNPNATAKDITALLNTLEATIIEGPKLGGVYRVRISNKPLKTEQIDAILKQMRERSDIITDVVSKGAS